MTAFPAASGGCAAAFVAERPDTAFPPPSAAASLYPGTVMHQRMKPKPHRFSYRVFNLLMDVDRLGEADRQSRLFSVNRFNALSFHEADHHDGRHSSLRAYVDGLLADAGLSEPAARVLLACYPRVFGQVFNPLAVYYAYGADDGLVAAIYEVRNTFGDRHTYVCKVGPGELTAAGLRQERNKRFHVSPFIGMAMRYRFRMMPPGDALTWRILETDRDGPVLAATFSGHRRALTTANIAGCLLRVPMQTWKIIGGIHFEALRLWLKGARYHPRPDPPSTVSFSDTPCTSDALAAHCPHTISKRRP